MIKEGQTYKVKNNTYAKEIGIIPDSNLSITMIKERKRKEIYFISTPDDGWGVSFLYEDEFKKLV